MVTLKQVEDVLKAYQDPEIGLDIWTMGFVRQLDFDADAGAVNLVLTLTSPMCPFGQTMMKEIKEKLLQIGVKQVVIELSFDPPWQPPPDVRLMLGL